MTTSYTPYETLMRPLILAIVFLLVFSPSAYSANPNTPANSTPAGGATGVSLTPTLNSGAFSDGDSDAHLSSRWQIREAAGTYGDGNSYDSLIAINDLTSHKPSDKSWTYKRTISLSAATPMDDYQVQIKLTTTTFDYSKVKSGGDDLRFYDPSDNELPYWIEQWDDSGTSIIWVKVLSASTSTITMLYGNPAASAASNGNTTFDFFDDFSDGDYTNNPTWTVYNGTWTINNNALQTSSTGFPVVMSTAFNGSDYVVEAKIRHTTNLDTGDSNYDYAGLIARGTEIYKWYSYGVEAYQSNSYWKMRERNAQFTWGISPTHEPFTECDVNEFPAWYKHKFQVAGTALKAKVWKEGSDEPASWGIETTDSTYGSGMPGFVGSNNSGLTSQFDDIFVRKYTVNEPTTTVGGQALNTEQFTFAESAQYYWRVRHQDSTEAWSGWSTETSFTTKSNIAPDQPSGSSPGDGSTVSVRDLTMTSSTFSDSDGETHRASQWRVSTASGDYSGGNLVHDSGEVVLYLTSYTMPVTLAKDATYFWQVRHQDSGQKWSDWSTEFSFDTAVNMPPSQPANNSPSEGVTDVSLNAELTASAFSDDSGDSHAFSQWQVSTAANFSSTAYDSGAVLDLVSHTVEGTLAGTTSYYWRARYQDDSGNWSAWSDATSFVTTEAIPDGAIAYWSFNESSGSTAYDATGNYDATIVNAAHTSAGKYGNALIFDGSGDSVSTPFNFDQSGGKAYTIEAWIYPFTNSTLDHYIFCTTDGGRDWGLFRNSSNLYVQYGYDSANWNTGMQITVDTWQHLVIVFEPNVGMRFYKDGSAAASPPTNVYYDSSDADLRIGSNRTGSDNYFDGIIDEVVIYDRALTAAEIALRYSNTVLSGQPSQPANSTPTNNATGISLNPTLSASAFSDPDSDSHQASQWQLRKANGTYSDANVYDSGRLSGDLTSHIPASRSWTYKRTISLSSATDIDNYQIKLELTPSNFDYNKAKAGGDDLRFYDDNGNQFSYWIEKWDTSATSIVWVNVITAGTSDFTMYYSNSAAAAGSNGFDTFDFFDNFNDDNYTADPAWTIGEGTWTVNLTDHALETSSTSSPVIYSPVFYDDDYIVEAKIRHTTAFDTGDVAYDESFVLFRLTDENRYYGYGARAYINDSYWALRERNSSTGWGLYATHEPFTEFQTDNFPTWYKHKVQVSDTSIKTKVWQWEDAEPGAWGIEQLDATYSYGKVGFQGSQTSALTCQFDDIFVRKYVATEPTATVGSETLGTEAYVFTESTQYFWRVRYQDQTGAWSQWSLETNFTTKGNAQPTTPSGTSPANGATLSVRELDLTSSAFDDSDVGDTHRASQWRVSTVSNDYSGGNLFHDSGEDTQNLTSFAVPGTLAKATTYYWQVRHQDNGQKWSDWSTEFSVISPANQPPYQPTNSSPASGASGVSRTPTLSASAFSDDVGDTHQASQWQVSTVANFASTAYDSGVVLDLVSHQVETQLTGSTLYYWRVRYQDNADAWSPWSDATSFTSIETTPSGAIAYWSFNETSGNTAFDSTGNYDATIINGVRTDNGKYGRGVILDGNGDYISTPFNMDQLGGKAYTVELWCYPFTTSTLDHYIFSTNDGGRDWSLIRNSARWYILYGYDSAIWNTGQDAQVDTWQHLVVIFEPNVGLRFYINGTKIAGAPSTLYYDSNDADLQLGSNSTGNDNFFDGIIDEVVVYERALTDAEVTARYNNTQLSHQPDQPANSTPADTSTDVSLAPTLTSSAFNDTDSDTHSASQWQIRKSDGTYSDGNVYDSNALSADLTSHTPTDRSWTYKRSITLSSATSMDDYQVKVELRTTNFDYSKAKSDGADLRFYDPDNNSLPYWIEKWDNSATSIIWVKLGSTGTDTITMYYGNSAASAVSNGFNTFDFFDDFNDDNYTANPAWTVTEGTWTVNTTDHALETSSTSSPVIYCPSFYDDDYIVEAKIRHTANFDTGSADYDESFVLFRLTDENRYYGYGARAYINNSYWALRARTSSTAWGLFEYHEPFTEFQTDNFPTWYKQKVQVSGTSIKTKAWQWEDAEPGAWGLEKTDFNHSYGKVGFQGSQNSALTSQFDDILVRKYAATEPTTTVGSEGLGTEAYVFLEGTQYFWRVRHQDSSGSWSAWSLETSFTTKSNAAPATPTASSPTGTVSVRQLDLTSSAFSDSDGGDTHRASQWRVSTVSGDYTGGNLFHDSGENTLNLTSYTAPGTLAKNITYYWQIRHQDNGQKWSDWSTEASFATAVNLPPYQPTNTSPADGDSSVSRTPSLTASAFSDDTGDTHQASQWQIATDANFSSVVYDSSAVTDLTSHSISSTLNTSTTYHWRVRYQDNSGSWSPWSNGTSFITIAVAPSGAIAYWSFNEASGDTAYDSAGSNDATIVNGVRTDNGKLGRGVILDGTGDYVDTPVNLDQLGAKTYTIETWVYPFTTSSLSHYVFSTDNGGRDWGLYRNVGTWVVYYGNDAGGWSTGQAVVVDTWQHLVVIFEPGIGVTFYINGAKIAGAPTFVGYDADDADLNIGANHLGSTTFFDGIIDEFIIYDRALTDAEVSNRFNQVQPAAPDQPTNQSPADTATDVSLTPTLSASAYNDANSDAHQASRWQVRPADSAYGDNDNYDSGIIFDGLTSQTPTSAVWSYRMPISLSPVTPMDDYQVKVLLTPATFDYSKVKSAGEDLRFFDSSDNPLYYWIEQWDTTDTSTIWVKVPNASTATIYLEYGNSAAAAGSNGFNTFDFFDDFNDGDYTANTKWAVFAGTWSVNSGALETSSTAHPVIFGTTFSSTDYITEALIRYTANLNFGTGNNDQAWLLFRGNYHYKFYGYGSKASDSLAHWELWERSANTTWAELNEHTPFPASMDQWYKHKVQVEGTNIKAKVWRSGQDEPATWGIETSDPTYTHGKVGFKGTNTTATAQFDDILVRKYTATEPVATLGTESTLPKPFTFAGGTQYFWRVQYQDATGVWSPWSFETSFTTRTNNQPATPTGTAPTGTVSTRYLTFTSSAFSDPDAGETHQASQWRLSTVSGDYSAGNLVHDSGTNTADLVSYSPSTAVTASTSYYWQVRHQDSGDVWSEWSTEISFTTGTNLPPETPANSTPADAATGVSRTPTLTGSTFTDDTYDIQQGSQWQVSSASDAGFVAGILYDSGPVTDMTSHVLSTSLDANTTYYWRVRYQDISDAWSAYSTDTSFTTTAASPSGIIAQWKLDNNSGTTSYDSENNYHGVITNATWTTGNSGSALNFDGSGDYVTYSDFSVPETFSASMWINPTTTTNGQSFIGKHDSSGNNIFVFGFWNDGYHINFRGTTFESGTPATGWQHLAVVVEKTSASTSDVTVYKNGAMLWTQPFDQVIGDTTGRAWTLGQEWDVNTRTDYYNGKLDEVILYNRALTGTEIQTYYLDTRNSVAPNQPTNSTPADSAIEVAFAPTMTASAFADGDSDTHTASRWQIRKNGAAYGDVSDSYDSGLTTTDLVSHSVPSEMALDQNSLYYWHVQYRDSSDAWSTWSDETSFTTKAANATPDTPTALSPKATTIYVTMPTLVSSAFADDDAGDVHTASQWRITKVSGDYTAPNQVYDSAQTSFSLTSHSVPVNLSPATTYYWQVRHMDLASAWSNWSTEVSFDTASNLAPDKPSNVTPATGLINISRSPDLSASAFSDNDQGDSHQASQWQISTDDGADFTANIVYDSGQGSDLTNHTVASALAESTAHYWRVRYQDSAGNWSSYSDETVFTTETDITGDAFLHWKFDDGSGSTATDSVGSKDGTITEAAWTIEGKHNGALLFDGYNDRVTYSFGAWTPESFSVEFWINPTSCTSNDNQRIFSTGGWDEFYFHTDENCAIHVGTYLVNKLSPTELPAGTLELNTWQHYVFTFAANTGRLYKNGIELASKTMTKPKAWTSFNVGRTLQYTIQGKVDEVIVYTRAINAAEVLAQYEAGGAKLSTPPNKPSNSTPVNSATDIAINPTLTGSVFADSDSGDTHAASRWQLRSDSGSYGDSTSFDSQATATDLTSITLATETAWADNSWSYRKEISLSPATSVANYQVKVSLSTLNFDYSKAKADGSDIRFYTSTGTLLNHYIEVWDNNANSTIWVKVAGSSTDTIYMYYGNSGASSISDPEGVFDLYDDFDGASLDATKWDTMNSGTGTTTVDSGLLTIASAGDWWNFADTARTIVSKTSFGTNYIAETKVDTLSLNNYSKFFGLRASSATNSRNYALRFDENKSHIVTSFRDTDGATSAATANNTGVANKWWPGIAKMVKNGDTVTSYYDGSQAGSRTVASWNLEYVALTNSHSTSNPYKFDWIRVRQYMATEPVATIGVESTQTAVIPLDYGTTYYWQVQYEDATGAWSQFSDETSFTTVNDVAPAAPSDLSANLTTACQVNLFWTDNSNGATGKETSFKIERKTGAGGSWGQIGTVDANVTTYADNTGLTANTEHFYRIIANNTGGDSTASAEDSATTTAITYYQDSDSDNYGNSAASQGSCETPNGYVTNSTDCDDSNAAINPDTDWYLDADGDGYSDGTTQTQCVDPGATYYLTSELYNLSVDCDDADAATHPGVNWYKDADSDGYSNGSTKTQCTDPGATYYLAGELTATTGDCNDANAAILPGATEVCDGADNDCDGQTDEGFATGNTYYRDADNDTYGSSSNTLASCLGSAPSGYVTNSTDCNDASASIKPGATEYCNSVDDDCDSEIDESCTACESTPSTPSDLAAAAPSSRIINLSWTDNSTCEDGFELEMKDWNNIWILRKTIGPGATSFADVIGIMPETAYTYRIRAYTGSNYSAYSNEVSKTTPAYTPGDDDCN